MRQGLLIYRPPAAKRNRIFVPKALRQILLVYYNNSSYEVHLGVAKTLFKLTRKFYWPGMPSQVRAYVRRYDDCQRVKLAANTQVGLHSAEVCSAPMERVYVDFMGPITRSKHGNVAILAVIDGFSKYVVLHAVRALTAKVVVDLFCKN
jgi:hypothetical protein